MFVIGIIETRNKIGKAKHIIGIVFGALSIIMGFAGYCYDWGVTALFVGIGTFSMRYRRTGSEAERR